MSNPGGRPRDPDLETSILDATIVLLREHGYSGQRVDDIAAATGCAKTTIYRRWPSLRHLVLAAMERAVGAVAETTDDDAVGSIKTLLIERSRAIDSQALLGVALDLLQNDDAELRQRYRERMVDPVRDHVIALIRLAATEGTITIGTDPTDLADALIGGLVYRAAVLGERLSEPELEGFVDSMLIGSVPRTCSPHRGSSN